MSTQKQYNYFIDVCFYSESVKNKSDFDKFKEKLKLELENYFSQYGENESSYKIYNESYEVGFKIKFNKGNKDKDLIIDEILEFVERENWSMGGGLGQL